MGVSVSNTCQTRIHNRHDRTRIRHVCFYFIFGHNISVSDTYLSRTLPRVMPVCDIELTPPMPNASKPMPSSFALSSSTTHQQASFLPCHLPFRQPRSHQHWPTVAPSQPHLMERNDPSQCPQPWSNCHPLLSPYALHWHAWAQDQVPQGDQQGRAQH